MTDCFICGHEILDGQPFRPFSQDPNDEREEHINPADHLPTLASKWWAGAKVVTPIWESAGAIETAQLAEREQAIKIVRRLFDEMAFGSTREEFLGAVEDRIRSGE